MTRAVGILTAIVTLAVSAAPVAAAGPAGKSKQALIVYNGHAGLGG